MTDVGRVTALRDFSTTSLNCVDLVLKEACTRTSSIQPAIRPATMIQMTPTTHPACTKAKGRVNTPAPIEVEIRVRILPLSDPVGED